MESIDLCRYLSNNRYPGRGICIGLTPEGENAVIAYWIMGRSVNSRNRIFAPIEGGIETRAADPSKLEDPHLIIYDPVHTLGNTHIVTNGDQTDTVTEYLRRGDSFENALRTRRFEDDRPNWTPRISGVLDGETGGYKLSILKSADAAGESLLRCFYEYPQPIAGQGRFISTYKQDGSPIPSFEGEPLLVAVPEDLAEWAESLWSALDKDNKVSLFLRRVNLSSGEYADLIINKYTEA